MFKTIRYNANNYNENYYLTLNKNYPIFEKDRKNFRYHRNFQKE